ncbi:hypothetical protein QSH18_00305 [Xanthomonas sp. NCPPB 2654]|uniref:hypothetical protein n=1 Tax=unclassified Xanthomonas TaxID=2643310 RepID=UPI0021DFC4F7|nr:MULTISPECIES: hypothetical protein [unclassified Xanthomonas]MDL5364042.1 hypothetical protein [Xanthomonas sp. NCPPB 2654]UYC20956.1 hypothetical protein NUG20_01210 [Xanthomonas sp. CFBP 8443]
MAIAGGLGAGATLLHAHGIAPCRSGFSRDTRYRKCLSRLKPLLHKPRSADAGTHAQQRQRRDGGHVPATQAAAAAYRQP